MKKIPKKDLNKPRFAVDINTSFNTLNKNFGGFATFTSTARITKSQITKDPDIIKKCNQKNYHIITHNTEDFIEALRKLLDINIGIICINLDEKHYLSKFGALLRKLPKHENYYNKLIQVGNETKIISYTKLRNGINKRK